MKVGSHSLAPNEFWDHPIPHFSVDINLGVTYFLEWKRGGKYQRTEMVPGALCVMPALEPLSMRWNTDVRNLSVQLAPSLILSTADDLKVRGQVQIPESHGQCDAQIFHIGQALWAEANAGYPTGRVLGESLGVALAAALLQKYGTRATVEPSSPRGDSLTPHCLNRVREYVEEHLDDIGLEDLAQVARLSPFYFARCFKATTGLTPHQYLLERRLERAKELLLRSPLTPAQVALQCGFSDQSHLTRHMKRAMGVTPAALVAERRFGKRGRH